MSNPRQNGSSTLWACAFVHAQVLVQWLGTRDPQYWADQPDGAADMVTSVLALAIATEAHERGLRPTQASDLDAIPIAALYVDRLDRARITHDVLSIDVAPADAEQGEDAYRRIVALAGDGARRDAWHDLIGAALAVLMAHTQAGAMSLQQELTLGQRRSAPAAQDTHPQPASGPDGPDLMRSVFPPEVLDRVGRATAAAEAMVLAYLDDDRHALAANAELISSLEDDPGKPSPDAGRGSGSRYSVPMTHVMTTIADWLDIAHRFDKDHFTNAEVVTGTRALITRLVPEEHQDAALAVAATMPSTGQLGAFALKPDQAELGELYFVTALAGWFAADPRTGPSRETMRTQLITRSRDRTATALGVPEAERISDVTDDQALALLDSLLGGLGGQAPVGRDPRRRSVLEHDIVAVTKAHMLQHPQRTAQTDRLLLDGVTRVLTEHYRRQRSATGGTSETDGMTETERRRTAKLAARNQNRRKPTRDQGRKKSAERSGTSETRGTPPWGVVPGMARDQAMPSVDGPAGPAAYHQRVLDNALHATLFLLNYVAFIADGGFDVPIERFAPQRADETDETYRSRRDAARLQVELQAAAGDWAQLCAEEISHIRPSDAAAVATFIIAQGAVWCRESSFDPSANGFRDGATPLLEALCPAEHRQQAFDVLDTYWADIGVHRPPPIEQTAGRDPIATIHVAAAMTGWLFSEPACVPDRTTAQRRLIEQGHKILNPGHPSR